MFGWRTVGEETSKIRSTVVESIESFGDAIGQSNVICASNDDSGNSCTSVKDVD